MYANTQLSIVSHKYIIFISKKIQVFQCLLALPDQYHTNPCIMLHINQNKQMKQRLSFFQIYLFLQQNFCIIIPINCLPHNCTIIYNASGGYKCNLKDHFLCYLVQLIPNQLNYFRILLSFSYCLENLRLNRFLFMINFQRSFQVDK
ncbi:hypothetical protein TTHERM_000678559 (macronuclear) [Tetrahymena thermophila SB210]|uniref:Uncharacterized protein n=1 Tax=Tetrahymena thermophila (strain SB210) TaxID=312017 RepID=W7XDV4_TETTS|nr:hypothetical protein TTHERM_000678559 [Tetrahymena thermophila SB210]EWS70999.1 hypothetical protein TTHERM_000678559 [Tetrahymena thermophila SB210]|eukprot:XP_012656483.1 hypothetical protein TTHERM_000678559 [Tetrahymena thermophila SB210]